MRYIKHESDKTYIVGHDEGLGVMESPNEHVEYLFETNDLQEAEKKAKEFYYSYNSKSDIKSGWCSHSFPICANMNTEEGLKLYQQFSNKFDKDLEEGIKSGKYGKPIEMHNGVTIYLETNPLYDDFQRLSPKVESSRISFLDINELERQGRETLKEAAIRQKKQELSSLKFRGHNNKIKHLLLLSLAAKKSPKVSSFAGTLKQTEEVCVSLLGLLYIVELYYLLWLIIKLMVSVIMSDSIFYYHQDEMISKGIIIMVAIVATYTTLKESNGTNTSKDSNVF